MVPLITKRKIIKLFYNSAEALEEVAENLRLGEGRGEVKHREYVQLALDTGLAVYINEDDNQGRIRNSFSKTSSGKKLEDIQMRINHLAWELDVLLLEVLLGEELAEGIK